MIASSIPCFSPTLHGISSVCFTPGLKAPGLTTSDPASPALQCCWHPTPASLPKGNPKPAAGNPRALAAATPQVTTGSEIIPPRGMRWREMTNCEGCMVAGFSCCPSLGRWKEFWCTSHCQLNFLTSWSPQTRSTTTKSSSQNKYLFTVQERVRHRSIIREP